MCSDCVTSACVCHVVLWSQGHQDSNETTKMHALARGAIVVGLGIGEAALASGGRT